MTDPLAELTEALRRLMAHNGNLADVVMDPERFAAAILALMPATAEAVALAAYDENAAALLDALPSFLDDVRAFMDSPEPKRSPGVMAERRRRLTVSLVWMGQRAAALAATEEER